MIRGEIVIISGEITIGLAAGYDKKKIRSSSFVNDIFS